MSGRPSTAHARGHRGGSVRRRYRSRNARPRSVTEITVPQPSSSWRWTNPRSLASSQMGNRGQDVRQAAMTSEYGLGREPIHSRRSSINASTESDTADSAMNSSYPTASSDQRTGGAASAHPLVRDGPPTGSPYKSATPRYRAQRSRTRGSPHRTLVTPAGLCTARSIRWASQRRRSPPRRGTRRLSSIRAARRARSVRCSHNRRPAERCETVCA